MREEKRSERIHDALAFLDDEMIEEVDDLRGSVLAEKKTPRYTWAKKWVAIAAGFCLLVVLGGLGNKELDFFQEDEYTYPEMQENMEGDIFVKPESGEDIELNDIVEEEVEDTEGSTEEEISEFEE